MCCARRKGETSKLVILFLTHRKSPGPEEVLSHCTVQLQSSQFRRNWCQMKSFQFYFPYDAIQCCISWLVGPGTGNTVSPCVRLKLEALAKVGWIRELLWTPHGGSVFWSSALSVKWGLSEVLPCLESIHALIPRPRGALPLIPRCHKPQLELVKLTSCLHNPFCQLRCYFPDLGRLLSFKLRGQKRSSLRKTSFPVRRCKDMLPSAQKQSAANKECNYFLMFHVDPEI